LHLEGHRDEVIAGLGGEAAVKRMDHDARADALEEFLSGRLDAMVAARQRGKEFPTVAELADKVDTRGYRRGTGKLLHALTAISRTRIPATPARCGGSRRCRRSRR